MPTLDCLYQFTSSDILNTSLIDVCTGTIAYDITTRSYDPTELAPTLKQLSLSEETSSGSSKSGDTSHVPKRRTSIHDARGTTVCEVTWNGRIPDITIGNESVGPLKLLFGSSSVPFQHNVLTIPSRFNPDWIWTATQNSLMLFDHATTGSQGAFHHNVVRLAGKDNFIKARIPGLGHNYLAFTHHDTVRDAELIVSFLMLEIVRRGRFQLTPYAFERAKFWQLEETRDLILRRIRRSTI